MDNVNTPFNTPVNNIVNNSVNNTVLFASQMTYTKSLVEENIKRLFLRNKLFLVLFLFPILFTILGVFMLVIGGEENLLLGYTCVGAGVFLFLFMPTMLFIRYKS